MVKMIKPLLIISFCFNILPVLSGQHMPSKTYSYLALGDSYTIGESLPIEASYPFQAVRLLEENDIHFNDPTIVAKTGWTTDELQTGINNRSLEKKYDVVTLLIGVNNQYRGRSAMEYAQQFEWLLQQAIHFAGNNPEQVIVLSIPDWGVTPFAADRDREAIAREIDTFNSVNKAITEKYKAGYINITPGTREAVSNTSLLADDKLHPSKKEYARWAVQLADAIRKKIK
jgi:lysophospholipase L1-like esterase